MTFMFEIEDKMPAVENSYYPTILDQINQHLENKSLSSQQKNGQKQLYRPRNGVNERSSEDKTSKSVSTNQSTEKI